MGIAVIPAPSSGLAVARFPAQSGAPFNVPAGLTLQYTLTTTQTFSAGQLPAQVWAVVVGAGGSGGCTNGASSGGGGGGGVVIGWVDIPSAGITATIGAGGASVSSATDGNRGGITYFGPIFAGGGGGGRLNGSVLLSNASAVPATGEGMPGYGGAGASGLLSTTNTITFVPAGAPLGNSMTSLAMYAGASTPGFDTNVVISPKNNYLGGASGGWANVLGGVGGSGYTGGGGAGGSAGGNSSRNGGVSNTYTGGSGASNGGGGGAGFLANGSNASGNTGGAGGSGGGGGGISFASGVNSGAGGNGCVLIYY